MQAKFSKREMVDALARIVRVSETKSTMPILSHVLFVVGAESISLYATDLYESLSCKVTAADTRGGTVAIPAKALLERVKMLPDGPVTISLVKDVVTIKADGSARKFTLRHMPGEDFPKFQGASDDLPTITIPAAKLASCIDRTLAMVATDDTRPHIASLLVEIADGKLRTVATDGHRLAVAAENVDAAVGLSVLVPRKAVGTIRSLLDESEDAVIATSGAHLFLRGEIDYSTKLTDAQFPPWRQVIPASWLGTITVPSLRLKDAVKAVSVAAGANHGVVLHVSETEVKLTATSPDNGEGEDVVAVESPTGKPTVRIGVQGKFLVDVCDATGDCDLTVCLSGELDPMVVMPENGDTYVIMPMRV